MTFAALLDDAWARSGSLLCVGLDPDPARLPACLAGDPRPLLAFNRAIVAATADLACAFKPQAAYYHAVGAEAELAETIAAIRALAPRALVILDAKRGDIGSTARQYAREAFDRYGADAVTVNPYLGGDALEPFLERPERGAFALCRTSNPGGADLQDLPLADGRRLYQAVADYALGAWGRNGNLGLVVGATRPEEVADLRRRAPRLPFLVPGVGAQGGDLAATLRGGLDGRGAGLLINSSRGLLYASSGPDFAEAARAAALELHRAIQEGRAAAAGGPR